MTELSLHARWIVPVTRPAFENGRVVVKGGRIAEVEQASCRPGDVDCGDAAIMPGFVNAHTHLELTHLRGRVPFAGSFTGWLGGVVAMQMMHGADTSLSAGVRDGLAQSLKAGATTVVDIGCGHGAMYAWGTSPVNLVGFLECIGMGPRQCAPHLRSIEKVIDDCQTARTTPASNDVCRSYGISPHAPYSTAPEVYRRAIEYVRSNGLPICTHLAETRDELEFLAQGTGPFRELLEQLGLWDGSFAPPGCSPVEYAERLGLLACRPILAHVNYASDEDVELIASRGASVVYCPRTHRFFEHEPHPYRRMLARGVNVCLGTDSLASTDTLSMLDELRFLRQADAESPDDVLLEMATIRGARAAGLNQQLGSIDLGKRADLVVVPLPECGHERPGEGILSGRGDPAAVYVGGQRVVDRRST